MKANSDSHLPGFFSLMSFIVKANYQLTGAHKRNKTKKKSMQNIQTQDKLMGGKKAHTDNCEENDIMR